ncbi:MAG TPA: C1 family peptidase, partial [Gemmatimonadaceae bacterium]|nr:C1 family peptidase [Gemmatimonadaceae bacterium]
MARRPLRTRSGRKLTARRDTLDFRDRMYAPALCDVAPELPLERYLERGVPVLDQENEGACTGFALATVANCLLRARAVRPDRRAVSPWMFYSLARRYDEWPGEDYEGSSIRGALKGWHKHGVCSSRLWVRKGAEKATPGTKDDPFTDGQIRPLGAYYRVDHRDLVAMHAAITEVGILYASGDVHDGWDEVGPSGRIEQRETILGAHAFAIVAYDRKGFWIQNSWGDEWGKGGFCHLTYDDWLANGTDVWVARLGVPVQLASATRTASVATRGATTTRSSAVRDLKPHVVSIGNDGLLRPGGQYGTTPADLDSLFARAEATMASWPTKRLLLYAHGGLVDEASAIERVATLRGTLLARQVYPISFIWKTDYLTTVANILADAVRSRRTEGVVDATKDFMLDRLDDALEPIARMATGKAVWSQMKQNALDSSKGQGGARLFLDRLAAFVARHPDVEIHVAAHSAGSIFMAPVVRRLTANKGEGGLRARVATLSLWAPACT